MGLIAKPEKLVINGVTIDLAKIIDWYRDYSSAGEPVIYITKQMKEAGYTFLGQGKDRITFLAPHKRFVLKFPRHELGLDANWREARLWATRFMREPIANHRVQFAPCRMVGNIVLMMRTVWDLCGDTNGCYGASAIVGRGMTEDGEVLVDEPVPMWADHIDAMQVGRLANGKWVAYDYADD